MTKHYFSFCRECSNPQMPELREFKEEKKQLECRHCGNTLSIRKGLPQEYDFYLKRLKIWFPEWADDLEQEFCLEATNGN